MLIVFIQASLLFFLYLFGSLLQETCFFNLEWFEQHFMQHVIIFILLKFSLLSYDLNIVCMIRMQKVHTTFETGWRILKNFQFHLIGLLCVYQAIVIGDVMKKMKIKIVKNMILHASSDFWLHLEKFLFKLENVISGINNDHLWSWKSGVFLQSTVSKNLRTLPLNKVKSMKCR